MNQDFAQNKNLCKWACLIAGLGALNWYLASMDFNIVNQIFGDGKSNLVKPSTTLEKLAYLVVGLSGVICLWCCCQKDRMMM